jgi:hypothetical protein
MSEQIGWAEVIAGALPTTSLDVATVIGRHFHHRSIHMRFVSDGENLSVRLGRRKRGSLCSLNQRIEIFADNFTIGGTR